jgi:oleate hydratase
MPACRDFVMIALGSITADSRYAGNDTVPELVRDRRDGTVMMPYASALFSRRIPEDRPLVIPTGASNFAFLGQFVELPEDTVFTVEYSVHCAMQAAYRLFNVNKPIPPIYLGILDPKVGLQALESAFK